MREIVLSASVASGIGIFAAAVFAFGVLCFLACFVATKWFKIKRVDFKSTEGLDGGFSPVTRICFISDLHFPMMNVNQKELIAAIAKEDCDAVAIGGDLCQSRKGKRAMLEFLGKLAASVPGIPVVIVLGNHDVRDVCGGDDAAVAEFAKELCGCGDNIHVLRDETLRLEIKGTPCHMVFAGLKEIRTERDLKPVETFNGAADLCEEGDKLIILAHNPDSMKVLKDAIEARAIETVSLCGHTHGGQFYLPFNLEFRLLRKDVLPREGYIYGEFDYCRYNRMYITCGLGQSLLPIRFRTTPEVAFVYF
ncbi:MAG: metallophosphoesterase [Clostridia bacterium]|nr:metallophosphoesterase [Clostridia bacterium]